MRTVISGPVTRDHLDLADIMVGILSTSLVTNGAPSPRADLDLPVACYPIDQRLGELGEIARDYTLCLNADAVIIVGKNKHLAEIARQYNLPIFEVER